jgi:hypothetical protein
MTGGEPGEAGPVIELWQAPDRRWRWRYLEPSADGRVLAFLSNKEYESRGAGMGGGPTPPPPRAVREPGVTARGGGSATAWTRDRRVQLGIVALAVLVFWPRRRRKVLVGGVDTVVRSDRSRG